MTFLYCRDVYKRTEWSVEVDEFPITLGGSSTATVPLPDRSLEACEVTIRHDNGEARFEDSAGSGRVTWNDARVTRGAEAPRPLRAGDRIGLGRVEVTYYPERPEGLTWTMEATPPPPLPEPGPDPRFGLRQLVALGVATWLIGLGLGLVLGILGLGR